MRKVWIIIIVALALIALLVGAFFLYRHFEEKVEVPDAVTLPGADEAESVHADKAPDFMFYDMDGESHMLSEYFGQPIVMNFWASWCPPCRNEMPIFQDAYEKYGDEVLFLMIDLTDGGRELEANGRMFVEEQGFTFPIYFDLDGDGVTKYSLYYIPDTYFIDSDGNISAYVQGGIQQSLFDRYLEEIMD